MKLLILQASDIHLSTGRYPDNPVLGRAPRMIAAVGSLFCAPEEVGAALLLVAGDVAYSGLKDEYKLATPFFRELEGGLKLLYPSAAHHTLVIPGNHDCNFGDDDQARQKLIDDLDPGSLADGSIVNAATVVQNNFFDFARHLHGGKAASGLERLFSSQEITVGGRRVLVRMLNSAWASRIPESRGLMLPVQLLAAKFAVGQAPAVAITALHHPYNWFDPDNARALRKLLEQSSDIILTGHEHANETYTKTGLTGEQNEYVEGGVLQESGDPTSSSFNVVVIDLAAETQEVHQFAWNGELYERVNEVVAQPFVRNKHRLKGEFDPSAEFEEELNDPDAAYSHPHKDRIQLEDVFVYPDCFELDGKRAKTTARVVHGRDLITHILKKGRVLITASERAGKTALGRSVFKDLRSNGKIPLMLSGRDIKAGTVKKLTTALDTAFNRQYSSQLKARYWQLPKESRAVVVDDYHRLPATKDVRNALLRELMQRFEVVLLLGSNELRVQELVAHDRESRLLWEFNHCEVMGFGHRLRAEFIKKWYRIGRQGLEEDDALVQKAIGLEKTISSILGHDLLPPYPVYLLLLLQHLESNNPHDTTAASYGRLYGAVVTAYLAKTGGQDDLETRVNYLTEFAYHLYAEKKDHLPDEEAMRWHGAYCKRHMDSIDYEHMRDELVRSQVLQHQHGNLRFRYKAGFYYFVASYLSDNLSKQPVREEVVRLCSRLHREDAANIVVFLCHRSKDPLVLERVLATANGLFADHPEADVVRDTQFTKKLVPRLPERILEEGDPEANRLLALEQHDQMREPADSEEEAYAPKADGGAEEDSEALGRVAEINAAIKTIQITGQILRNYGGRLEGSEKVKLTDGCFGLGLRLLKFIYAVFEEHEGTLVGSAQASLLERFEGMDARTSLELANALVFGLLKLTTIGLVKHVSNSVGLEKLAPVFSEVLKGSPTVARRLIDLSIRLDHYAAFPVDLTLELYGEVQESLIVTDALRQLVFNRFYYFTAPYQVKQLVCNKINIKMQPLLLDRDPKKNA